MEQRVQGEYRTLDEYVPVRAPRDGRRTLKDGQFAALRSLEGVEADGHGGLGRHGLQGPGGVLATQKVLQRGNESLGKIEHN